MTGRVVRLSKGRLFGAGVATAVVVGLVLGGADQANAATTVGLGTADSYEVLAGTTVTNTGLTTVNGGDVGVHPGSAVTGFPPGIINGGVIHAADAQAEQAKIDLTTAYNNAAGQLPIESGIIDLVGRTLVPGVYSGDALELSGTLTLDGDASSIFIFQAASTLITSSGSNVLFTPGTNQCNVFWQVGSSATLGTASTFVGTVMALTSITAQTGATVTGRLLARNGAVTLDANTLNRPSDCTARTPIAPSTPSSETIAQEAAAAAAAAAATAAAAANAASVAAAQAAAARAAELAATGPDAGVPTIIASSLVASGFALLLYRNSRLRKQRRV